MRRRPWLMLLGLLAVLLAVHSAYWFWAERQLRAGLSEWVGQRRAAGWAVTTGAAEGGGWPLDATLVLPSPAVEGGAPTIPGGVRWTADQVTLGVSLLDPRTLFVVPSGVQHLQAADWPAITVTADRFRMDVKLTPGVPPHVAQIRADNVRLGLPGHPGTADGTSIALLQSRVDLRQETQQGQPAIALTLDADAIGLPPGPHWPLGNRISSLSFVASLDGAVPEGPDLARSAAAWRDAGGKVVVDRFSLGWGPLGLAASGHATLDDQLQPDATADARMVGYADALDVLAANGVLNRRTATAVKAILALIATTPDASGGDEPTVEVPLTLRNGTVSMRQFPLARLPPLVWPPPAFPGTRP